MTTQNKIEKMEIENNLNLEIRNDVLIVTNKETFEESRYEIESQEYEGRMLEVLAFVETLVNEMTNLEIRIKEEMARATSEETKYQETLEGLLFDGTIFQISVEDHCFNDSEVREFCEKYAHINMAGSIEDRVLNFGSELETVQESIETICKKELERQIKMSKEDGLCTNY